MRARRLFLHTACRRSPASRPSFHVCKNICFLSMSAYPSLFYSWPRYPFSSVTVQKLFLLPCFSIFLRLYAQDFQVAIARTSLSGIHHRMRSSHDAIQESFKSLLSFFSGPCSDLPFSSVLRLSSASCGTIVARKQAVFLKTASKSLSFPSSAQVHS